MWTLIKAGLSFATDGVSSIVTWALSHWRIALAVLFAVFVGGAFWIVVHERNAARAQVAADALTIKTLTDQKDALQANVSLLTGEIGKQNASITALGAAAAAAQKAAQDAIQAAAARSKKDAATIADLQRRGADQSNTGSCDAEISRIRSGL